MTNGLDFEDRAAIKARIGNMKTDDIIAEMAVDLKVQSSRNAHIDQRLLEGDKVIKTLKNKCPALNDQEPVTRKDLNGMKADAKEEHAFKERMLQHKGKIIVTVITALGTVLTGLYATGGIG